jgi:hypothetical protein
MRTGHQPQADGCCGDQSAPEEPDGKKGKYETRKVSTLTEQTEEKVSSA